MDKCDHSMGLDPDCPVCEAAVRIAAASIAEAIDEEITKIILESYGIPDYIPIKQGGLNESTRIHTDPRDICP